MLETKDFIFAFTLHLLVMILIFGLNQWRVEYEPKPERTMQVQMVSLQELQSMLAKPEAETKAKARKKKPDKPQKKTKPKAVLSPKSSPKAKKRVNEEDLDYDPFAPLESKPKKLKKTKVSGEQELKELLKAQLTTQELNRYIAGMQKAVEQNWKVPMEMIDRVKDALVLLQLYPNGQVANITILESSGSAMLDETLKQAIYAAAPFELPSKQFALFKSNEIRFFPLK